MFWFDFANVVSARVDRGRRAEFDAKFREKLLHPVTSCLTSLSSAASPRREALQAWQAMVDEWQIPYLGPAYTGEVLSQLGVRVL
mmetsp:Transcript_74815/g.193110  ORF Transcript_74815/g.193110 Transcript_74815/m.193110 type:complete len:85 (-) Transcript_74815:3-257(-)